MLRKEGKGTYHVFRDSESVLFEGCLRLGQESPR